MITFTETPIKDIWQHLLFFSAKGNCIKLLNGEIKSNRNIIYDDINVINNKASEISMCIKQAYEYFMASENVSINTSPLLLYYGINSLAKALIVANNEKIYLKDISHHGLKCSTEILEINNEYVILKNGTFKEFLKIIDPKLNLDNETILNFKDMLSCIPELKDFFKIYYQEPSNVVYLYNYKSSVEESILEIYKNEYDILSDDIKNNISQSFICSEDSSNNNVIKLKTKSSHEDLSILGCYDQQYGSKYLIFGLKLSNSKNNNSTLKFIELGCIDFAILFLLSNLVRYKQVQWNLLVQGDKEPIVGLINIYLNSMKRRFPNMILNHLYGEEFFYGTTSYLG